MLTIWPWVRKSRVRIEKLSSGNTRFRSVASGYLLTTDSCGWRKVLLLILGSRAFNVLPRELDQFWHLPRACALGLIVWGTAWLVCGGPELSCARFIA